MTPDDRSRSPSPGALPPESALPPLEALRAFDAIARLGGIRRAAECLKRDHGVVSRHLRTLEDWTGTKLIERTASGVVLTNDGRRYHKHIAAALEAIAAATGELMRRGDDRRLCIRCMPGLALHWLSPRLADLEAAYPDIEIEVRPSDPTPEVPTEHGDVHLRLVVPYVPATSAVPSEFRAYDFARSPVVAVASRDYLAQHAPIRTPRDLLSHTLLHEEDFSAWIGWLAGYDVRSEKLNGLKLWQGHLTLDAARHGRGIALMNYLTAASDFAARRLVEIGKGVTSFEPRPIGHWRFIARADRWDAAPIRSFRTWLDARVRSEHPELAPGPR